MSLAVVRDEREARAVAGPSELAAFETDVLAGFVLARAAVGLSDATIRFRERIKRQSVLGGLISEYERAA